MNKGELRKHFLNKMKNLTKKERQFLDEETEKNLIKLDVFKESKDIMTFVSLKYEINTIDLIDFMLQEDKNVYIPLTIREEKKLIPSLITSLSELVIGNYGILEPYSENIKPINPNKLEIILVPGLIFSQNGHRIGYGGGYYDRFLSNINSKTITIGYCYDFQLIDSIPKEKFDIPVDMIITNKRIVQCI